MTTPTNEEVRRQFEALIEKDDLPPSLRSCAEHYYQAALSSPAVVALVEALRAVAPYVVSDVLEHCDGNKCREQWCAGCMGDEHAEASVEKAREASSKLYAAIAPFTTGAGHEH